MQPGTVVNVGQMDLLEQATIEIAAAHPTDLDAREVPRAALEALAVALGCAWATFWKVEAATLTLRAAVCWSNPDISDRRLRAHTLGRNLSMSEGTAGHVWRSQKPVWTKDLARDMCLPRSLDAVQAGLQGGVWFAVKAGATVFGVVELLGPAIPTANDELLKRVERLGTRLGSLLEKPNLATQQSFGRVVQ